MSINDLTDRIPSRYQCVAWFGAGLLSGLVVLGGFVLWAASHQLVTTKAEQERDLRSGSSARRPEPAQACSRHDRRLGGVQSPNFITRATCAAHLA